MSQKITDTLASHIIVVYNEMERNAEDAEDLKIYTGAVSNMIKSLGISMTYYKPIFRALYDNGYCAMGDRGGKNKPSTIILLRRPERDELLDLTSGDGESIISLVNRVESLESSVGGLHIVTALAEFERRLATIEKKERASGKGKAR